MTHPVTVSVTRRIDPEHTAEMQTWVKAGASLAERFDGFLGVGWIRPNEHSDEWHMLYRFANNEALAAWERSDQRRWWLGAAQGRIEEGRQERRTGIEGWFDEPSTVEAISGQATPAPTAPPRWKQMITIFMVFFPLSLSANFVAAHTISGWPLALRVLATVLVMTPLMTYVFLPWITRTMHGFLHGPTR